MSGEREVAVQLKVVLLTEDCIRIFVAIPEHCVLVVVVFIIAGTGFTVAIISVLDKLAQLFARVTASA
jgi:hypothetical protein